MLKQGLFRKLASIQLIILLLDFSLAGRPLNVDSTKFLAQHNDIRREAAAGKLPNQPSGVIPDLTWDAELAEKALKYAMKCPQNHNPDRKFQGGIVGENLAWGSGFGSAEKNLETGVNMWKNEYKFYRFPSGFSMKTGHYTQLVWADTKKLGCGMAACGGGFTLVCNYYPAGNMQGEAPYETR